MKNFKIIHALLSFLILMGIVVFLSMDCSQKEPTLTEKPYLAGEVSSATTFKYGRFVVRMKPERKSGVLSSFFTFDLPTKEEIDIEFVDGNNDKKKLETNFHYGEWIPCENKETIDLRNFSTLNFNTDDNFHIYSFEWTKTYLAWSVDNIEVYRKTGVEKPEITNNLTSAQHIVLNIWTPLSNDNWSGKLNENDLPAKVEYDWIKQYSWNETTGFNSTPDWEDNFDNLVKWHADDHTTFDASNAEFVVENNVKVDNGYLTLWLRKRGSTIPNINNGIVAYYPFNGNANDESGNGNNGIQHGATLTTDRFDKIEKAYLFNGKDNYINISTAFFNNGWQGYTISGWFNCIDISQHRQTIFNTNPSTGIGLTFNHNDASSPNRISYYVNSHPGVSTWDIFTFPNNISKYSNFKGNQWYHIVFQKSGNTYNLYINGILDITLNGLISPINYNCGIRIGAIGDALIEYFHGKLDDIRIYNRVLTDTEIQQLYHEGGWTN
ncbi:MAG: family 16 glycosylhydrolase [Bacteroidia bacterium]|nr:family 16 glycosylhydrolase [Bacteroidia bacterium]